MLIDHIALNAIIMILLFHFGTPSGHLSVSETGSLEALKLFQIAEASVTSSLRSNIPFTTIAFAQTLGQFGCGNHRYICLIIPEQTALCEFNLIVKNCKVYLIPFRAPTSKRRLDISSITSFRLLHSLRSIHDAVLVVGFILLFNFLLL